MSFPAPSDFSVDTNLNLNDLIKNPSATFFLRVEGDDLIGDCICAGDLLIVDRSLEPFHGCMVVAVVEGELLIRQVHQLEGHFQLKLPRAETYYSGEYETWGVITHVIHSLVGS